MNYVKRTASPRAAEWEAAGLDWLRIAGAATVAVAQLVERQVVVLDVAGSSPVGHPEFPSPRVLRSPLVG